MSHDVADTNGRHDVAPDPYAAFAEISRNAQNVVRGDLQVMLLDEQTTRQRLEGLLRESREREKRVAKALEALTGESAPKKRGRPAKHDASYVSAKAQWTVSVKSLERAFTALRELDEPSNVSAVNKRAGLSPETTRRALTQLRDQERVRVVRVDSKLGAMYAAMPGAEGA